MKPSGQRCSFCEKSDQEVLCLISGPQTWICNECVSIALMVMIEKQHKTHCLKLTLADFLRRSFDGRDPEQLTLFEVVLALCSVNTLRPVEREALATPPPKMEAAHAKPDEEHSEDTELLKARVAEKLFAKRRAYLAKVRAEWKGSVVDPQTMDIDAETIHLIPFEVAHQHRCIALSHAGSSLVVAMADPTNKLAVDDLKFLTGCNIEIVLADDDAIQSAIDRGYEGAGDPGNLLSDEYLEDEAFEGESPEEPIRVVEDPNHMLMLLLKSVAEQTDAAIKLLKSLSR